MPTNDNMDMSRKVRVIKGTEELIAPVLDYLADAYGIPAGHVRGFVLATEVGDLATLTVTLLPRLGVAGPMGVETTELGTIARTWMCGTECARLGGVAHTHGPDGRAVFVDIDAAPLDHECLIKDGRCLVRGHMDGGR